MTHSTTPARADTASAKRETLFARLEDAVGAIQDSESFRRYLDVQRQFHRYSWNNVLLILLQRPDATQVAGFHAWLKLKRFVRRGEKGITIIVPMRRKASADGDPSGDEDGRLFFGSGTVFDVSQTDGEPLPEITVPVLDGAGGADLYRRLQAIAKHEGLSVRRVGDTEQLGPTAMGLYHETERLILVREAAPLQMVKTLAHELAHHLSPRAHSREQAETVAEAVAYIVCGHFGHDTGTRSFPYVATWAEDKAVLKQVLTVVQRVSATMIDRVLELPLDQAQEESR